MLRKTKEERETKLYSSSNYKKLLNHQGRHMTDKKEDSKEENIDLDGSSSQAAPPDHDEHMMDAHYGNLEVDTPGMSNEELLDAVLNAPEDKLIPWEECTLPSFGVYYGWPDGVIQVRAMGQKAEKILATQRLAASGQSIDYLFRECCKFPGEFDPAELLLGDRVFLLYFLRGITHGNMYEFAVQCSDPDCQSTNTHTYDLNWLADTVKPANKSLGVEPFKIHLPYMTKSTGRDFWVGVRFLRALDANDIVAKRRARKKMLARPGARNRLRGAGVDPAQQAQDTIAIDNALDENLEKLIVNVLGVEDRFKIRQFVGQMHAQDTATIREWIRENTPGIDSTIEITCPNCGGEFTVELPITESFFRPTKQRKSG
jgi:hypothetical protein